MANSVKISSEKGRSYHLNLPDVVGSAASPQGIALRISSATVKVMQRCRGELPLMTHQLPTEFEGNHEHQRYLAMLKLLTVVMLYFLWGIIWAPGMACADYSPSGKDWMKNLDDDLLITQITIPGTHDSAADHDHCAENQACKDVIWAASTQTFNIQDQMEMGIRFFDIRLAYDEHNDRAFEFHHGPYDLKQSLYDAIEWATDFLKKNPSEFLIWLIKQEHTDASAENFWYDLSAQLADRSIDFYSKKKILTVGEARGKVIVMARNGESEYDQGYHVEWPSNTLYYSGKDKDLTYVAEDHYSLATIPTSYKFVDIRRNLFLARSCSVCGSPNTLFFTFLSGEGDSLGKGPAHYADYENLHTAQYLTEDAPSGPRSGIVAMDYAGDNAHSGDYVLDALIGQNLPHRIPGWFGDSNEGGGITVADINDSGKPELIVLSIDAPKGANGGYYSIGWDLDDEGKTANWSDYQSIPWQGDSQAGGGIAAADMNNDGTPDLIVFMIDNPDGENAGYYRIGYMDNKGNVTQWTDFNLIPGWFGTHNDGGGITAADMNNDGSLDLIVFMIDNPDGPNYGYYRIGYMDNKGNVTQWTDFEQDFEWFGAHNDGGGITAADINGDGKPELILFMIYDPSGKNQGYYRILWNEGLL